MQCSAAGALKKKLRSILPSYGAEAETETVATQCSSACASLLEEVLRQKRGGSVDTALRNFTDTLLLFDVPEEAETKGPLSRAVAVIIRHANLNHFGSPV